MTVLPNPRTKAMIDLCRLSNVSTFAKAALFAVAFIAPTQSFAAVTCPNPAICIAVCGARTCGRDAVDTSSRATFTAPAPRPLAVKPVTCPNPAICIAVCGKKTCG
jgi:hypothetical protein